MKPNESLNMGMLGLSKPNSFDPIHADQTNNIFVARLVHMTPLEVSSDNKLVSNILSSFSYSKSDKKIQLEVKVDRTFTDGSRVEAIDVAIAIARFAYFNPTFPLVSAIRGVDLWAGGKSGLNVLPEGIVIVGQTVQIALTKDLENPLFRLALEVFGVIPHRCIDLDTGKINCKTFPMGGYYSQQLSGDDGVYVYKRNSKQFLAADGVILPEYIKYHYVDVRGFDDYAQRLPEQKVVFANDIDMLNAANTLMGKDWARLPMPSARFAAIQLNEKIRPFDGQKCRKHFATTFRSLFSERFKEQIRVSKSIFTPLLPGYLTDSELDDPSIIGQESDLCDGVEEVTYFYNPNGITGVLKEVVVESLSLIGVRSVKQVQVSSDSELSELFLSNTSFMAMAMSGFWAQDPVGDVQMLFAPGFHRRLNQVTEDTTFSGMVAALGSQKNVNAAMKTLNRFLYEDAKLNVFCHAQRFYAIPQNASFALRELASAITAPSPWHLLR